VSPGLPAFLLREDSSEDLVLIYRGLPLRIVAIFLLSVEGMLIECVHWQKQLARLLGEMFIYLHNCNNINKETF